jgi:hypothetical protein
MVKNISRLCLGFCLTSTAFAQLQKGQVDPSRIPTPTQHYLPEYTFDKSTAPEKWTKHKPGLHVSFVSTDELHLRTEPPEITSENNVWESTGWKGERLHAQILARHIEPDSVYSK